MSDHSLRETLQFVLGEVAILHREVNSLREELGELKREHRGAMAPLPMSSIEDVASTPTNINMNMTMSQDTQDPHHTRPHDQPLLTQEEDQDALNRLRQLLQPQKATLKPTNDSVTELYEEYERGIHGNPSLRALESAFGNTWRSAPATNMAYSRRLVVVREIEKRARDYAHCDGRRDALVDDTYIYRAINELEDERRSSKLRMHAFIQRLKNKRDGGEWMDIRKLANLDRKMCKATMVRDLSESLDTPHAAQIHTHTLLRRLDCNVNL
ncbi:hypothetical protein E3P92_01631 [Wallemia ichthyophaga]|nr:hypothetical protein E3P91_01471 [Wallemia ichthyophaga]TIB15546.1 hypothetical protein E3P92_01631 [Wallemia ichthyophaga]